MLASIRWIILGLCLLSPAISRADTFKLVYQSDSHIILEFTLDKLTTNVITNANGMFTRFSAEDFSATGDLGGPEYLTTSRLISIPPQRKGRLSILKKTTKRITLRYPPNYYKGAELSCSSPDAISDIAAKPDLFTSKSATASASLQPESFLGPIKSTMVTVNPIQFDEDYKTADVIEHMIMRIDFARTGHDKPATGQGEFTDDDLSLYQSLFINKSGFLSTPRQKRLNYDLIVSDIVYQEALQVFIKFKEKQGRGVIVKYFSNPTTSDVKNFIASQYQKANAPRHTILVGNITQIPSFRTQGYWSDHFYTLLDDGPFPDLSLGRLPAHNASELKAILAKIIAREIDDKRREAILLGSGHSVNDCNARHEQWDALFFQNSQKNQKISKYCGTKDPKGAVLKWWEGPYNLVILDGAGDQTGISDLAFDLAQLTRLKNAQYPIVIDMACQNARWPSTGAQEVNFAERLLQLPHAGSAGILASTHYSKGEALVKHMLRAAFFDDTRSEAPYHQINDIGLMILFGKVRNLEQFSGSAEALAENNMFMYLGDPSSTLSKTAN